MNRPRILDLYCGAGGAAVGYHRAGFDVVGVDVVAQPNYPFPMVVADALDWLDEWVLSGHDIFDCVHASPPCQAYAAGTRNTNLALGRSHYDDHPRLIEPTRELLVELGVPYIIENVVGAPLIDPVRLCGTSFGLPLRRHRLFESSIPLLVPPCAHEAFTEKRYWTGWTQGGHTLAGKGKRRATTVQVYGNAGEKHEWPAAMGIDWMTYDELAEAIPPAYTELLGSQLLDAVRTTV